MELLHTPPGVMRYEELVLSLLLIVEEGMHKEVGAGIRVVVVVIVLIGMLDQGVCSSHVQTDVRHLLIVP
jgi:hypothetical protein